MSPLLSALYQRVIRTTLVPLFLMLFMPQLTILLPYITIKHSGHIVDTFSNRTVHQVLLDAWATVDWLDPECWLIVLSLLLWCLITQATLPGKLYYGPMTSATSYQPQYWDNATAFYLLTMVLAVPAIGYYSVGHLVGKFFHLVGILNVLGFAFSALLYIKGHLAPDGGQHDPTGNPLFDFYWGLEHYPQLGRYINIKILLVSRFGHILWQLIVLVACKAHYELHATVQWPMVVVTSVMTLYIAKALYWEPGYTAAFDTTYDRLGWMIIWGMLTLVPCVYTLPSFYYLAPCPGTNTSAAVGIVALVFGLAAVICNYWTDRQKVVVRKTEGATKIWGKKPLLLEATWTDDHGVEHTSPLLASGFWGVARHLNYTFEVAVYLSLAIPVLWTSPLPYFTPSFLLVFFVHRALRDDAKCKRKYGDTWQQYCQRVPCRLLPGVF